MPNPKSTPPRSPSVRWNATLLKLPALSVRHPWAWLIVAGFKDVENRGKRTNYRGPVLIHAGTNQQLFRPSVWRWLEKEHQVIPPDLLYFGGILGVVDIVDCVTTHSSPWFAGEGFGYVLANPRRLPFRPCKGQLGLFKPTFTEPEE